MEDQNTQDCTEMEMPSFIGVKIVKAIPQRCPSDKYMSKAGDPGYLVKYEDGYISWSPKAAFDAAYQRIDTMNFGLAIEAMKKGHKVARKGWNGKNMWIVYMSPMDLPEYYTQGTVHKVNDRIASLIGEDTPLHTLGYFAMWTADGKWLPGWLASQTDMLADDWQIV